LLALSLGLMATLRLTLTGHRCRSSYGPHPSGRSHAVETAEETAVWFCCWFVVCLVSEQSNVNKLKTNLDIEGSGGAAG
jgi:hypothetical protein